VGGYGSTRWGAHLRRATLGEAYLVLYPPRVREEAGAGPWATRLAGEAVDRPGRDCVEGWGTMRWERPDGSTYATMGVRVEHTTAAGDGFWLDLQWHLASAGPAAPGWSPDVRECRVLVEPVALTYGRRWFLACPRCGRRRTALYLPAAHYREWRCRACWHLGYHSQRLASHDRLTHRAQKLTARLGADWNAVSGWPPKPPRMHWRTYRARLEQLAAVEEKRDEAFVRAVAGLLARYPASTRKRR
jgi:hypothetical protein